jgi:hypothetical protein
MSGRRALCVSDDPGVRRDVGDALAGAGYAVDACDALPLDCGTAAIVVVDRAARQAAGARLCGVAAPVVVVGDNLDDEALFSLMADAPVSHLVEDPRDRDLGITSEKLASGDLFGLEKYLAAGARVGERVVASDGDRRAAIGEISAWAEGTGARRPLVHRLANVVDELLMNALFDAPALASPAGDRRAVLRFGRDDRALAISVSDPFGSLSQRDVIDNIRRARSERGRPQAETASQRGAGLGLYFILANVASLVVNIDPGHRTEVVCLFDLVRRDLRPAVPRGVRSLHVFAQS